jgi:hypothetical protein
VAHTRGPDRPAVWRASETADVELSSSVPAQTIPTTPAAAARRSCASMPGPWRWQWLSNHRGAPSRPPSCEGSCERRPSSRPSTSAPSTTAGAAAVRGACPGSPMAPTPRSGAAAGSAAPRSPCPNRARSGARPTDTATGAARFAAAGRLVGPGASWLTLLGAETVALPVRREDRLGSRPSAAQQEAECLRARPPGRCDGGPPRRWPASPAR